MRHYRSIVLADDYLDLPQWPSVFALDRDQRRRPHADEAAGARPPGQLERERSRHGAKGAEQEEVRRQLRGLLLDETRQDVLRQLVALYGRRNIFAERFVTCRIYVGRVLLHVSSSVLADLSLQRECQGLRRAPASRQ